ncbi:unnamed protein product [Brassica rapa]|uniref:Uncharacterized protein n=1 Tax=Brassica campestris TaxID=3711 RepID=A0A3P6APQ2_BRACM|nr:unnamed protein product [Brassica rapa]VDC91009.1 unnamed protein product [Brassica rapa]
MESSSDSSSMIFRSSSSFMDLISTPFEFDSEVSVSNFGLLPSYQTRNQFEPEFKNQIPSASVDSQSNRKSPLKISRESSTTEE